MMDKFKRCCYIQMTPVCVCVCLLEDRWLDMLYLCCRVHAPLNVERTKISCLENCQDHRDGINVEAWRCWCCLSQILSWHFFFFWPLINIGWVTLCFRKCQYSTERQVSACADSSGRGCFWNGRRSGITKHSPSGVSYHLFTLVLIIVVSLAASPLLSAPTCAVVLRITHLTSAATW